MTSALQLLWLAFKERYIIYPFALFLVQLVTQINSQVTCGKSYPKVNFYRTILKN